MGHLRHLEPPPSQSAALAASVAAAIRVERPNLAAVGRRMAGPTTAESAIKRARRLTDDHRGEVADPMAGVIDRPGRRRKKRLTVSFDRTEARDFHCLMAAASTGGGAVPLPWAGYPEWKLTRSRNGLEGGPRGGRAR